MFKSDLHYRKWLILILIVYIFLNGILYIRIGLMPDESNLLFTTKMMTQGFIPYKDYATDIKAPGMYYYLYPFLLITENWAIIKFSAFFINALSSIFLFMFVRRIFSEKVAFLSSILFLIVMSLPGTTGYTLTADRFVVLFSILTAYSFHRSFTDRKYLIISGIFLGLAFIFKQTGIMLIVFIFLFYLMNFLTNRNKKYAKNMFMSFFLILLSFAIPVILVILHYAYVDGLDKMIYWTTEGVFNHYKDSYIINDFIIRIATIENAYQFSIMSIIWLLSLSMILLILFKFIKNSASQNDIFLLAWIIGVSYPFIVILKYYMLLTVPMVILTSVCLIEIFKSFKKENLYLKSTVLTFFFLLIILSLSVNLYSEYNLQRYQPKLFSDIIKTSEYVKENTKSNEKIFVLGYAHEIYLFSGRNPPLGMFYLYLKPTINQTQEESTIGILSDNDIKIIVIAYTDQPIKDYIPDEYNYIQKNYNKEKTFGLFDIYRKNT